jgi:hypothetical protein
MEQSLEKLIVARPVEKLPAVYATQSFGTVFTRARFSPYREHS